MHSRLSTCMPKVSRRVQLLPGPGDKRAFARAFYDDLGVRSDPGTGLRDDLAVDPHGAGHYKGLCPRPALTRSRSTSRVSSRGESLRGAFLRECEASHDKPGVSSIPLATSSGPLMAPVPDE
jgi:hypothetical protein